MLKSSKKSTLSDRIADVLNTAPASFDPEDDNVDDTRARILENHSDENEDEEEILSEFRKKNVDFLADVDERYAGKKSNRKNLYDSDDELSEGSEDSEQENLGYTDDGYSKNKMLQESGSDESQDSNEQSEVDAEDSDEKHSSTDNNEEFDDNTTKDQDDFKHMKETNMLSQVQKGLCVRNQMNIWENLLEMRIQLQKCLITANKMPQKDTFMEIKKQSDQEFSNKVTATKKSLTNVLDKLLTLQKLVLKKYPETRNLNNKKINENADGDDEEIPSDTEDEKSVEEFEDALESVEVPKKRRKLNDFEKAISEQHQNYKNYRNNTIQKWNEKTRIAVIKNNTNSQSIINHIEHTLSDKVKLVRRTQLKRSDYKILGQEPTEETETQDNDTGVVTSNNEYNPEIFDDDDFYHQLLRELIEVKSADLTDPVQLGRQWIQLQNLRSKMKRKIDTRATKGRKIRYTVHTKLVNLMAPIVDNSWTDEAKTELYNSLFGKNQHFGVA